MAAARSELWERVLAATRRAAEAKALVPLETETHMLREGPVEFIVRLAASLARKPQVLPPAEQPAAAATVKATDGGPPAFDPFLPYDPVMYVDDLPPKHVALLNKFPVVPNHLVVATKAFERQTEPLNAEDLGAVWHCLRSFPSLAFFNGGELSGASQPHKHLQVVPLPLATERSQLPIEHLISLNRPAEEMFEVPELPFQHRIVLLDPSLATADAPGRRLHALYDLMMQELRLYPSATDLHAKQNGRSPLPAGALQPNGAGPAAAPSPSPSPPVGTRSYNLLLTSRWMLVVPRCKSDYGPVNVNGLGFAGTLLVKSPEALAFLREVGPLQVLCQVAGERPLAPPTPLPHAHV